jgi:hypothetical protein
LIRPNYYGEKNITVHRDYLVIQILWYKIIEFGDRKLEIPLVNIPNSPLCPYQAYTNMCKLVPADNNDPTFLICHGHVRKVLTYIQYQGKLRDTLKRCKLNPSDYSSHSFSICLIWT